MISKEEQHLAFFCTNIFESLDGSPESFTPCLMAYYETLLIIVNKLRITVLLKDNAQSVAHAHNLIIRNKYV